MGDAKGPIQLWDGHLDMSVNKPSDASPLQNRAQILGYGVGSQNLLAVVNKPLEERIEFLARPNV